MSAYCCPTHSVPDHAAMVYWQCRHTAVLLTVSLTVLLWCTDNVGILLSYSQCPWPCYYGVLTMPHTAVLLTVSLTMLLSCNYNVSILLSYSQCPWPCCYGVLTMPHTAVLLTVSLTMLLSCNYNVSILLSYSQCPWPCFYDVLTMSVYCCPTQCPWPCYYGVITMTAYCCPTHSGPDHATMVYWQCRHTAVLLTVSLTVLLWCNYNVSILLSYSQWTLPCCYWCTYNAGMLSYSQCTLPCCYGVLTMSAYCCPTNSVPDRAAMVYWQCRHTAILLTVDLSMLLWCTYNAGILRLGLQLVLVCVRHVPPNAVLIRVVRRVSEGASHEQGWNQVNSLYSALRNIHVVTYNYLASQ